MTPDSAAANACDRWPRLWRLVVIALGMLVLCSCRAPRSGDEAAEFARPPALPPQAFTGETPVPAMPGQVCPDTVEASEGPGCPTVVPPWTPPGLTQPWPQDEYLCDGGDAGLPAAVGPNWQVHGLGPEDTVAHFDTLDGRRLVQPSNRVCLYSPRFGAVRQVVSLVQNEQMDRLGGVHLPVPPVQGEETQIAACACKGRCWSSQPRAGSTPVSAHRSTIVRRRASCPSKVMTRGSMPAAVTARSRASAGN